MWGLGKGGVRRKKERKKEREEKKRTIIIIITNDHLLRLTELAHLAPEILVKRIEVILQLARVHLVFGIVGRILVQIR